MKNYRTLFPIILTALMIVSVYSMISGAQTQKKEISQMIKKAESYAEQELYDKAAGVYNEVILKEDRVEYYLDVIDMFYTAKNYEESGVWCKNALKKYPKEEKVYEKHMKVYIKQEDYAQAFKLLDEFDGRELSSKKMEEYRKEISFTYQEMPALYDDISQPSGGYASALDNEKWGVITTQGKRKAKAIYKQVGYFANGMIPVCDEKGTWYFMKDNGELVYNISKSVDGTITDVGLYNEELVNICVDGSYSYYNINFEKKLGPYDYAGSFNAGVAAVKKGDKWQLINTEGEAIIDKTYKDIIVDERGICCAKERIFVKTGDEYIMIDTSGQQLGKETFENAKIFANGDYAAIMKYDLWGFVDKSGKTVIEPKYQETKSFSMGLAAVCKDDLWGYIDENGNEIIKIQLQKALTFSSDGTAFIKDSYGTWKVYKLYKYNH